MLLGFQHLQLFTKYGLVIFIASSCLAHYAMKKSNLFAFVTVEKYGQNKEHGKPNFNKRQQPWEQQLRVVQRYSNKAPPIAGVLYVPQLWK